MHEAVLIVDGNCQTLELARRVLQNERYDVRVASDAEQALELLATFHPRLILTDMRLPGRINAIELVRRVRAGASTFAAAVVMVTTDASEAEAAAAMAAGCDEFISRPLSTLMLRGIVAAWMAKEPGLGRLAPTGRTWMSRLFGPARRRRTVMQIPSYKAGSRLPPVQHFTPAARRSPDRGNSA